MSAARYQLTPAIQSAVCGYILSGGFPHVAAEAAGIPREVFDRWLQRGCGPHRRKKYRLFYDAILQARAQARLSAESRAIQKDALAWLKCGPGKETTHSPGWTNPTKPQANTDRAAFSWLLAGEVQEMLALVLRVLAPHPELRAQVAEALAQQAKLRSPELVPSAPSSPAPVRPLQEEDHAS